MSYDKIVNELKNNPNINIKTLIQKASQDDAIAQLYLGICYKEGLKEIPKDLTEAVRLFDLAATNNCATAQYCLGLCYVNGLGGLEKNKDKAIELLSEAGKNGDELAYGLIATIYCEKNDMQKAEYFFLQAVSLNDPAAKTYLGLLYSMGDRLKKDEVKGFQLIQSAAEQGLYVAKEALGNCYEKGYGVAINVIQASRWYYSAMQEGNNLAKTSLYNLFRNNPKVPEIIYRTAKGCDVADAKYNLNQLAIQQPEVFDELVREDSLESLDKLLYLDVINEVEKRRKNYAEVTFHALESFTSLDRDSSGEVVKYFFAEQDGRLFFKRQKQDEMPLDQKSNNAFAFK